MRSFQAILVVGGVLALIGAFVLVSSFDSRPPEKDQDAFQIPVGGDYYYVIGYKISSGAHVSITYTVTSGGSVDVHLFDEGAYNVYDQTMTGTGLASSSGSSGTLQADVLAGGNYYVTFDHGAGYELTVQDVRMTIEFGGTLPTLAAVGALLLIAGIAVAVVGARKKSQAMRRRSAPPPMSNVLLYPSTQGPTSPPSSDVTFYQGPKPPENPPATPP